MRCLKFVLGLFSNIWGSKVTMISYDKDYAIWGFLPIFWLILAIFAHFLPNFDPYLRLKVKMTLVFSNNQYSMHSNQKSHYFTYIYASKATHHTTYPSKNRQKQAKIGQKCKNLKMRFLKHTDCKDFHFQCFLITFSHRI